MVKDGIYVFDFEINSVVVGTINVKKEDYENSYYVVKNVIKNPLVFKSKAKSLSKYLALVP